MPSDDRQRLRREAVKRAKGNRIAFGNHQHPDDRAVLAMESLLVEAEEQAGDWKANANHQRTRAEKAEATIAEQAKEIERLRSLFPRRCSTCKGTGRHKDPMWTSDRCGHCGGRGKASLGDEGLDPVEWSAGQ